MDTNKSFDGNRTIMRPKPGRRNYNAPTEQAIEPTVSPYVKPTPALSVPLPAPTFDHVQLANASSVNTILHLASDLLTQVYHLRNTTNYDDTSTLFLNITNELVAFQKKSLEAGYDRYDVAIGSELLCCFIDEIIRAMPWSNTTVWTTQSLLNHLHQTNQGGEHFFAIVTRLLEHGKSKIDLIELAYVLLSLGFVGRYQLMANGHQLLHNVKNELYTFIERTRGTPERALSVNWQGTKKDQEELGRFLPWWVAGAALCCFLLLAYTVALFSLNRASDPVALDIISLTRDIPAFEGVPNSAPSIVVQPEQTYQSLATLLADDIDKQWLSVEQISEGETVILKGDRFFNSGSGDVNPDSLAVIERIKTALNEIPGEVIISGHTDNIPIKTLRFPSNLILSQSRAESVATALSIDLQRIRVEARGDSEPRASNDSADERALNRRVEITLLTPVN